MSPMATECRREGPRHQSGGDRLYLQPHRNAQPQRLVAGGYWTHVGPGGWYLDAVLQGTWYGGSARTQFARLDTNGTGFISSLEGGYPFALPQFGPGFVIEPQGQILWQKVAFAHAYDGLGDVGLGETTGTERAHRAEGQMDDRDRRSGLAALSQGQSLGGLGGAGEHCLFGNEHRAALGARHALEFGGGLTAQINANLSLFANADYEFAVGNTQNNWRSSVQGSLGARYTW